MRENEKMGKEIIELRSYQEERNYGDFLRKIIQNCSNLEKTFEMYERIIRAEKLEVVK